MQVYRGLPVGRLRQAAADFFRDHVQRNIFPEMLELVTELQRRGTEIWAVSSTCDWVIEEGVKQFGIPPECVLAACVFCENGNATDCLRDVPTDEGKVAALARVGITATVNQPDCVFGNSIHDAAMLAVARSAFPVNPSPALAAAAAARGWPLYYPAGAAPQPLPHKSVDLPPFVVKWQPHASYTQADRRERTHPQTSGTTGKSSVSGCFQYAAWWLPCCCAGRSGHSWAKATSARCSSASADRIKPWRSSGKFPGGKIEPGEHRRAGAHPRTA